MLFFFLQRSRVVVHLFGALLIGSTLSGIGRAGETVVSGTGSCGPCTTGCQAEPRADEVWTISCRHMPCLSSCGGDSLDGSTERLRYWRLDTDTNCWQRSDRAQFFATESLQLPTTIWAHGDRLDADEAMEVGLDVYDELMVGASDVPRIRFILWSWPAEQVATGPYRDARIKAVRTVSAGYRLGELLTEMDPTVPTSLFAFSFGARVVTAAMHALGGGTLSGHALPKTEGPPRRYRLAFMAAAIDNTALLPGQPRDQAITQIEHLLLLNNPCDWILKRYPKVPCGRCGPDAIGYAGLARSATMTPYLDRIRQVNVASIIGKRHAWKSYVYSPATMRPVRQVVLFDLVEAPSATP